MDDIIDKPCEVDRAREAVLEYLLLLLDQELWITSHQNVHEMIVISTWYLWWDRHMLVHEGKAQNAQLSSMGIRAITTNYVNAHSPNASIKKGGWSKPPLGLVKLNTDASFDHDLLKGTAGAVLRNNKGNIKAQHTWKIDHCIDALTAEAWALRFGLSLAQRAGCNRLVINSYNLEVIETMNNGGRSAGAAAAVFDDCYFLACDFPTSRFEHCNREANKVAHELVLDCTIPHKRCICYFR